MTRSVLPSIALAMLVGCASTRPSVVGVVVIADGTVIEASARPEDTETAFQAARCSTDAPSTLKSSQCREEPRLHEVAVREGGADWKRSERVVEVRDRVEVDGAAAIQALQTSYLSGQPQHCQIGSMRAAVQPVDFLARFDRHHAAAAAVYGAACTWAAGDHQRATELADEALVLDDLDFTPWLSQVSPDIQLLFADRRKRVPNQVDLQLTVTPRDAQIAIDGRRVPCCTVKLRPGKHMLVLERFGYRREQEVVTAPETLSLTLSQTLRDSSSQLASALHATPLPGATATAPAKRLRPDNLPTEADIGARASDTFHAPVVLVLHRGPSAARAFLYDRRVDRILASREALGADAAERVTALAIRDWRTKVEHVPLYKNWKVWAVAGAIAAVATGTAVYLTTTVRDDFVFKSPRPTP